jgi:RNA polymerase sigma-70 factor (ECF subfamily)
MCPDQTVGAADFVDDTTSLLLRARSGDHAAMETLFTRHLPALRRWASGRLPHWARDIGDTADLVQDTMLETFKRIETFEPRGEGALQAYLRAALLNRVRLELRRRAARPAPLVIDSGFEDQGTSPLEAAIGSETSRRYEQGLSTLADDVRAAVVARVELGLTFAEIAELTDKPSADAARMTVVRGLLKLAEAMERG